MRISHSVGAQMQWSEGSKQTQPRGLARPRMMNWFISLIYHRLNKQQ